MNHIYGKINNANIRHEIKRILNKSTANTLSPGCNSFQCLPIIMCRKCHTFIYMFTHFLYCLKNVYLAARAHHQRSFSYLEIVTRVINPEKSMIFYIASLSQSVVSNAKKAAILCENLCCCL